MTDVTFVRTRTEYPPYEDYYTLASLSGFPVCYVDEIDPSDPTKTYIISPLNGEWQQGWPHARARIIFNQLEWHTNHSIVNLPPGVSECWNGDKWHAGLIHARYVPLGSHPYLNLNPNDCPTKEYDVAFMAYTDIYRRKCIKDALETNGFKVAPNAWGRERHEILTRSRCIVHVHQWENIPALAPLRWCIAAAYKLPIVSESVNHRGVFGYGDFMTCEYDSMVEFVTMHLRDRHNPMLENYGYALYSHLCNEMNFRESVERAL